MVDNETGGQPGIVRVYRRVLRRRDSDRPVPPNRWHHLGRIHSRRGVPAEALRSYGEAGRSGGVRDKKYTTVQSRTLMISGDLRKKSELEAYRN